MTRITATRLVAIEGRSVKKKELAELVKIAQTGNLDAFEEIVCRFQDMACGYCYSLLGDFHIAQDAAQEAFLEAYRSLPGLTTPAAFPGWFRRIVARCCNRLVRKKRPDAACRDTSASQTEEEDGPERVLERREMAAAVQEAIRALPPAQRAATTLFYINGYSQQEVATFLETPLSTVKKRLVASRRRLKERMMTMVEDVLKSNRPDPSKRQAIMDELMSRKTEFDRRQWRPSQEWAQRWHLPRMEDVHENASQYGLVPDESLPRMLPEYQAKETFRDDFTDIPRRWGIPEGTEFILLQQLCRRQKVSPVDVVRWMDEGLPTLRYRPWYGFDAGRAETWISEHRLEAPGKLSASQCRELLLVVLHTLADDERSLAMAEKAVNGLMAGLIRTAGACEDLTGIDLEALDPLWAKAWLARHRRELEVNAQHYGVEAPAMGPFGVPQELAQGKVFEIRDLSRRLGLSPFDIVRWTREGMPSLHYSPFVRWDAEHVTAWLGEHCELSSRRHTVKELDDLNTFVLQAVAGGSEPVEDARDIFTGWAGLM